MTVGLGAIGVAAWSVAPPHTFARILLRVAALSVILPMVLALQYAWALTTGGSHLPLAAIASIHGTLNAFGFSIGGLVAWRLLAERSPIEAPASVAPFIEPAGAGCVPVGLSRSARPSRP